MNAAGIPPDNSPVHWEEDGTPRSTLFDDVYRSQSAYGKGDRGLAQSRGVFLQGCGLWPASRQPTAWCGQHQWHVLETGFGLGLNFLATWLAWQQDPQRPERLFFTSIEAWPVSASDIVKSAAAFEELQPLARTLAQAWRGLLPGMHRLVFEGGRVQLSLCIGPIEKMLRDIDVAADSVYLDGFSPAVNPQMWSLETLKAISRLCRKGTRVASWCVKRQVREDLAQCGFEVIRADGVPPKAQRLQATFNPQWAPRSRLRMAPAVNRQVLVLGAGLSGSAIACSLARRGWQVTVLDAGAGPGAGASGLPAGLTVPHVSPDDSILSRITRAGVRATLQRSAELLESGQDWDLTGVLEHRVEGKRNLPTGDHWPAQGHEWSTPALAHQIALAGLPPQAPALWHAMAAWVRPLQLVKAQLQTPGVTVRWNSQVSRLERMASGDWRVLDGNGQVLGEAPLVVIAGGFHSLALLQTLTGLHADKPPIPLNPLRGQISFGPTSALPTAARQLCPPFPVNGHGSFIHGVPMSDRQPGWFIGSTFERHCEQAPVRAQDHAANRERLATLLPALGRTMAAEFEPAHVQGWAGLRCTLPDRLPATGPVDSERWPGLWVSAGMGARGISLSVLAGELTAAWLENEPLPLQSSLASHLAAERFIRKIRSP